MPDYLYKCPNCEHHCEINHMMSEIDNPSEKTILETSCNEITCPAIKEGFGEQTEIGIVYGTRWIRVPQMFGMPTDNLANNPSKREAFLKQRRKRNARHFDDEVMPGLGKGEQTHFKKKRGFKS